MRGRGHIVCIGFIDGRAVVLCVLSIYHYAFSDLVSSMEGLLAVVLCVS